MLRPVRYGNRRLFAKLCPSAAADTRTERLPAADGSPFRRRSDCGYNRGRAGNKGGSGPGMQVTATEISEVKLIKPMRHYDERGFFSEIFRESVLQEHG